MERSIIKYWCFTCKKEVETIEKQNLNEIDIICCNCLLCFIEEIEDQNSELDNPKDFKVKENIINY